MIDRTAVLNGQQRAQTVGDERAVPGPSPGAAHPADGETTRTPGDLRGKFAVVTGANTGLGYQTARQLTAMGATVVLACRHPGRMRTAADAIRNEQPEAVIGEVTLDLGSLRSVRSAARQIADTYPRLDILVNNAAVMGVPQWTTLDGFETHFGVNHLGHFAFTGLLLDKLLAAPTARIVSVSSIAHHAARLDPLDWPNPTKYKPHRAYAASKLANLIYAYELHRRLANAGSAARSIACHPGWSETQMLRKASRLSGHRLGMTAWLRLLAAIVAQPPEGGARPTLHAASGDVHSGAYVGPTRMWHTRGPAGLDRSSDDSRDVTAAQLLWDLSTELTGVNYGALAVNEVPVVQAAQVVGPDTSAPACGSDRQRIAAQECPASPESTISAIRPASGADLDAVGQLHQACSARSRQRRYLGGASPSIGRLRHLLEPTQGLTLLATAKPVNGVEQVVAMANLITEGDEAEVALLVRDDWQRRGLGAELLRRLIQNARSVGCRTLVFHVHTENTPMLKIIAKLGMNLTAERDGSLITATLLLDG
ncbi:oxidoreductase [Micromonospora sp. CPCC 205558]|uniref:oxidoreductase n=1 Tax=Micromonospora sp. CPCC 205558 TaxID=3122403 RepID=UPI002FF2C756